MSNNPKTWWGEKFVTALEGFIDSGRLQRGKSYSSDSRVLAFDMQQEKIKAQIRGNVNPYFGVYKEPKYKVSIAFDVLTKKEWQSIIQRISENPSWLAKLMLKEVPDNIDQAFAGTYLLPTSFNAIKADCSCPDYANPCKHIAGVYYRIAKMLDSDPMLLFELRGLKKQDLVSALERTELGRIFAQHISAEQQAELEIKKHKYSPFKVIRQPKRVTNDDIWIMKPLLQEAENEESTSISAGLIKKQGDYPAFWQKSASFISVMEDIYKTTKRKNIKKLM